MKEKVILAYSGGLDTTAIIPWLKENFDYDVVCCCIDVGQESFQALRSFILNILQKNLLMIISCPV